MSKRFFDTTIWTQNKWFRKLRPEHKLFWAYLFTNCDAVGVWEEDLELASILIGYDYDMEQLLADLGDRVKIFSNRKKWWVVDFCNFQYGELVENNIHNKPHQSYISLLKKHRLWIDYTNSIHRDKEKEKEKDIEKEKEKEKRVETAAGTKAVNFFESFWSVYPRKVGKAPAKKSFEKIKMDQGLFDKILKAVEKQIGCGMLNNGQYTPHPATWLNQERWNDELTTSGNAVYIPSPHTKKQEEKKCEHCDKPTSNFIGNHRVCDQICYDALMIEYQAGSEEIKKVLNNHPIAN